MAPPPQGFTGSFAPQLSLLGGNIKPLRFGPITRWLHTAFNVEGAPDRSALDIEFAFSGIEVIKNSLGEMVNTVDSKSTLFFGVPVQVR